MKFVVLHVADPFAPARLDVLRESEQVLAQLDSALVHSGNESIVMAPEGSVTEGILLATPAPSVRPDDAERERIREQNRFTIQTFLKKWPIDLIHMHSADFYEYLPPVGIPVLVTLYQPLNEYPEKIFHLDRPHTYLHCLHARQRETCPPGVHLLPDISDSPVNFAEPAHSLAGSMCVLGHGQDLFDDSIIEKYFAIYEQLVTEARALEDASAPAVPEGEFESERLHVVSG